MRILGCSSFTTNTAAAILENGVITTAIENDKIVGKRTRGLPEAAIRSCFENTGTWWNELDAVAVATQPLRGWARKAQLRARLSFRAPVASAYYEANEIGSLARQLNDLRVLRKRAAGSARVSTFNHHLCHAASSFYLSPFDRALILTADEHGDGISASLAIGEGNRIRVLRTIPYPHSIAWIYSQVTDLVGFLPHQEEHKTQWLSLEGEPSYKNVFMQMLGGASGPVPRLDYSFFNPGLATHLTFSQKFYRQTGLPADSKEFSEEQRKALASSVQEACAEVLAGMIEHFRRSEGVKPVCLAGGLFQNALLVSFLEKNFDQVFVPPTPANAGTALGAALLAWYGLTQSQRGDSFFDVFCGPRFTNQQIKEVLDNCKARYSLQNTQDRQLDITVRLLGAGKIVGWFQNGCEFGPRALGARSVLASPWAPYVKENLNDFIKHREWFRPFAIAVPEEDSSQYFEASAACRFMNSVATTRPEMKCLPESFLLPQNRVRLHVVAQARNRLLWQLLRRFGEHAPAPMLLNTSFNLAGEPLVVTPRDALRSYSCSGLDALVIGNFVLCKSSLTTATRDVPVSESMSIGV